MKVGNTLEGAITHQRVLPANKLSLTELSKRNKNGRTYLQLAVIYKRLKDIPQDLITAEGINQDFQLFINNREKPWSTLDAIAETNQLKYIPAKCWKELRISKTAFSKAAGGGCLKDMPTELLTIDNLLEPNGNFNAFHAAAARGLLAHIPIEFLTIKNLLVKNKEHADAIMIARMNGRVKDIPLGLQMPESHKVIVGEGWWAQNLEVLNQKAKLLDKPAETTVDIF